MLKANSAGRAVQLYLSTELWPLIKLLGFHTNEVSTTKLIVHLTQPAVVAVARVWKSWVLLITGLKLDWTGLTQNSFSGLFIVEQTLNMLIRLCICYSRLLSLLKRFSGLSSSQ